MHDVGDNMGKSAVKSRGNVEEFHVLASGDPEVMKCWRRLLQGIFQFCEYDK